VTPRELDREERLQSHGAAIRAVKEAMMLVVMLMESREARGEATDAEGAALVRLEEARGWMAAERVASESYLAETEAQRAQQV
jgi:hypothetical protein